jgi:glucoamylase
LLTGERAHYELAAGHDITPLIRTYEAFATKGQLMPEQVWDSANLPDRGLRIGQPAGSATPLVWAHAEYLKLLRSALDGQVFDRVDPVYERYCTPEGRKRVRHNVEIFSLRRPIQKVDAGDTLRIIDVDRFDLVWSIDNWKTVQNTSSRQQGSAGFSADIPAGSGPGQISWTLKWPDKDRWLGYNVTIAIARQ